MKRIFPLHIQLESAIMIKQLHFIELGNPDYQTIVFLHGLGATHRYWKDGIAELATKYHVILLDLLGFGESPKPWQNYTQEKHLLALYAILKNHNSFIIVGHSLGAALSIAYAQHYPKQVKGLILMSFPVFIDQPNAYRWMRRKPSGWLLTNIFVTALLCIVTRFLARKILHHFLKQYPKDVIDDLVKHNMFSSTTSLWNVIYNQSILKNLDQLDSQMKVTCIHAINDQSAPYENIYSLVESQTNWELRALDKGDHHPWLWEKEISLEILKSTLKRI